jgi:hypothetical protein
LRPGAPRARDQSRISAQGVLPDAVQQRLLLEHSQRGLVLPAAAGGAPAVPRVHRLAARWRRRASGSGTSRSAAVRRVGPAHYAGLSADLAGRRAGRNRHPAGRPSYSWWRCWPRWR